MNENRSVVLIIVACFFGMIAAALALRAYGVFDTKTFGVAQQNADTEVFEHSEAYKAGVRRDMDELYLSYVQAKTPEEKAAVLAVIRHRAEGVADQTIIPANVRHLLGGGT